MTEIPKHKERKGMKLKLEIKKAAPLLTICVLLIASFFQAIHAQPVPVGDTVQSNPFESNPTAGSTIGSPTGGFTGTVDNAKDGDFGTNINWRIGGGGQGVTIGVEMTPFENSPPAGTFTIGWVDIKVNYKASATVNDQYRIIYKVGSGGTWQTLQDWISGASAKFDYNGAQDERCWSNVAEPDNGVWDWTDIGNVYFRVETMRTDATEDSTLNRFYLYEVWLTIYEGAYPGPGTTVSIQPPVVSGLLAGDIFFVDVFVTNVTYMHGFQFLITYDTAVLTGVDYFSYNPFILAAPSEINDTAGYVAVSFSSFMGDSVGLTGSEPVVRIYFLVDSDGISLLHFSKSIISDVNGGRIDHTVSDGVFTSVSGIHDIAVTGVGVTPTAVAPGETVAIYVTVWNQGTFPETFNVTVYYDSTAVGPPQTVTSMSPGTSQTLNFVWDTTGVSVGRYLIKAEASVVAGEIDTSDNLREGGFVNIGYHDVAVTSVLAIPPNVTVGQPVSIGVGILNEGAFTETFNVTVFYESSPIETQTVTSLPATSGQALTFIWNTTGIPGGTYFIKAEASLVPGEFDTADNTYIDGTVTIVVPPPPSEYTRIYLPNQWVSDGTPMGWHADDNSWPYTLPFDFPFYGTYYREIYISSNGLISFTGYDSSYGNSIDWLRTKRAIAVAWEDWETYNSPYDVYIWQPDSDHFIIRWYARRLGSSLDANFEAILARDGVIQFNYGYNGESVTATIGISNGAGDILAEDLYNLNYINTIVFTPYRPEHELQVSLTAPPLMEPNQSTVLTATVFNLGQNNETNVEVYLRINDATVNSTVIPELQTGTSYAITYVWTPTVEGIYNVTAYAPPVEGESSTVNNFALAVTFVRHVIRIGIIETHGEYLHNEYLPDYYRSMGYVVDKIRTTLTPELLANYHIIMVGEDWYNNPWLPSEIAAVQAFIDSGKGFVGIGDELAASVQQIISSFGISYTGVMATPGSSTNFDPSHPIMQNVTSIYASAPINSLQVTAPAYYIANDASNTHMLVAGAEVGGFVLVLSNDFAADLYIDGNAIMFRNIVTWMTVHYEHELAVSVDAPSYLKPGDSWLVSATVFNRGLNDETNVELRLLINDEIVSQITIPLLQRGSYAQVTYLWAPLLEGAYNITGYAPPVPGETQTTNNRAAKSVTVQEPIIHPEEGQYANYIITYRQKQTSQETVLLFNATYSRYISPNQMNITLWQRDPYGNTMTTWIILNVMNRWVETGVWSGQWYPLWIEPDVTVGSSVNILNTMGNVTGSRLIEVGDYLIDCWELAFNYYSINYVFLFDKFTGVVTKVEGEDPYTITTWTLEDTNILELLTMQANPSSGIVGAQVTIAGGDATPNGTVELYWENTVLGTTVADSNGNFSYTFTIPSSTRGEHYIRAIDTENGKPGVCYFTVVSSMAVTPQSGPMGTKVQLLGLGFTANEHVVLTFEDMQIIEINADDTGSFTAAFNIPLAQNGQYLIKAWYGDNYVQTTFTVTEVSELDVNIDVGTVYFKGETAEFYVQTAFYGKPIDVTTMNATIYMPGGTRRTLVSGVATYNRIATGLYKILFTISGKGAMTGTYTLVVQAARTSSTLNAYGTSIRTFIVKSTWEKNAPTIATLSVASIGLVSAMVILWQKEKKKLI